MRFNWLSLIEERLVSQSRTQALKPSGLTGRPNFDTTAQELVIVNLIS